MPKRVPRFRFGRPCGEYDRGEPTTHADSGSGSGTGTGSGSGPGSGPQASGRRAKTAVGTSQQQVDAQRRSGGIVASAVGSQYSWALIDRIHSLLVGTPARSGGAPNRRLCSHAAPPQGRVHSPRNYSEIGHLCDSRSEILADRIQLRVDSKSQTGLPVSFWN